MKRLLPTVLLLLALPVLADVVIRTRDGGVYRVPVNPQDVISIEMAPGGGGSPPPQAPPPPSSLPTPTTTQTGMPWVVNSNGNMFRGDGRSWPQLSGAANDIGVGAEGSVWVIGTNAVPGGFGIWRMTGSSWTQVDGGAVQITVDRSGERWVVNSEGRITGPTAKSGLSVPTLRPLVLASTAALAMTGRVSTAPRRASPWVRTATPGW